MSDITPNQTQQVQATPVQSEIATSARDIAAEMDSVGRKELSPENNKLCRIEDPDCESCQ